MTLQLAEGSDYTPVQTNQGTLFVRNDMLSEGDDTTLSAKGALIQKALPVIAKAAPLVAKAAPIAGKVLIGANPIGAAGLIAAKALPIAKAAAGQIKASRAAAGKPPLIQSIGAGLKKLATKAPAAAVIPAAAAATAAAAADQGSDTGARQAADMGMTVEKPSFFKKYRTPILIAGGVLAAGTILYFVTRKKRK